LAAKVCMMLSFFKRIGSPGQTMLVAAEPAAPARDLEAAIGSIGSQASSMGREAAEVRGVLEDTNKVSARQVQTLSALAAQVQEITRAQDAIGEASHGSLAAVERARKAVDDVGGEVGTIVATLRQVSQAAHAITKIALQTRLVAFNASVEAKRAGDAGRGFGVVADAVKDLAAQVESSSKEITSTVGELDTRIESLSREIRVSEDAQHGQGAVHRALVEAQSGVTSMAAAAEQSRGICTGLNSQMHAVEAEIAQTASALDAAMTRSESFLKVSERLIELVAECGIETDDTPLIHAAKDAAARVGHMLEEAVGQGEISVADLFDEKYLPVPDTNPQQHTTRFVALADRLFPSVQEPVLASDPRIVACVAADRNGYVPTHNAKYNHPQRSDVLWNIANCRNRRIHNDRTGLASARNQRPFLLQTFRRDMGGGQFVMLKEVAAPIVVQGRHWGGFRIAFNF
jgi:methyl-accepting chemotaxis protein